MRTLLGSLACMAALVSAACSAVDSAPTHDRARDDTPAVAEQVWRHGGLRPVSNLAEAADGVLVYYGIDRDQVRLQALDAESGKALWARRVESERVAFFPVTADGHVVMLGAGAPNDQSRVLVVDAVTGAVVSRSEPLVDAALNLCADEDDTSICVESGDWSGDRITHRVMIPSGELRRHSVIARESLPGVERLAERGWTVISSYMDLGGKVRRLGLWRDAATAPYRRTDLAIAALNEGGSLRWLLRGRQWCDQALVGDSDEQGVGAETGGVELACRFASGRIGRPHVDEAFHAKFSLEGIDLASGNPVWDEPVGYTDTSDVAMPTDAEGRIAVGRRGRTKLIDLATGSVEMVEHPLLWSTSEELVIGEVQIWRSSIYRAEVDGRPALVLPWPIPEDAGLQVDDLTVVPHPNSVVAYRKAV